MTSQQNQEEEEGSSFDHSVAQNIAALRKARGWTQEKLAQEATTHGVPLRQQTIVKIEKGQRPLRLREANAIASSLGVSIDELLTEDAVRFDDMQRLIVRVGDVNRYVDEVEAAGYALQQALAWLKEELERVSEGREIDPDLLELATSTLQRDPAQEAERGAHRYLGAAYRNESGRG